MASGSTYTCPSNTACSNTPDICASPSIIPADCPTSCGTCSTDGRFACINSTTYALCFGSTTPSSSYTASCPTNQYCDITATAPSFCSTDSTVIHLVFKMSPFKFLILKLFISSDSIEKLWLNQYHFDHCINGFYSINCKHSMYPFERKLSIQRTLPFFFIYFKSFQIS